MSDLGDLYQEMILEHGQRPRNFGPLADADGKAFGNNPLCGDSLTVFVKRDGDVISDVRFHGDGCAISKAAASLMTGAVKGKTLAEVEALFHRFHDMVTGADDGGEPAELGKLVVFAGIKEFPVRVKCASLAWHTLRAALAEDTRTVTTE